MSHPELRDIYHGTIANPANIQNEGLFAGLEAHYLYGTEVGVNPAAIYTFANPLVHSAREVPIDRLNFPAIKMELAREYFANNNTEAERILTQEGTLGHPDADRVFKLMRGIDSDGDPVTRAAMFAIMKMFQTHKSTAEVIASENFPSIVTIRANKAEELRLADDLTFSKGAYLLCQDEGQIVERIDPDIFFTVSLSPSEVAEAIDNHDKYDRLVVMLGKLTARAFGQSL